MAWKWTVHIHTALELKWDAWYKMSQILKTIRKLPLVAFNYTVESFVEWSRCEIAAPVMIITVGVCVKVTGEDGVTSRNVTSHIRQSRGSSGTLTQGTEIVGKCSKANLRQITGDNDKPFQLLPIHKLYLQKSNNSHILFVSPIKRMTVNEL